RSATAQRTPGAARRARPARRRHRAGSARGVRRRAPRREGHGSPAAQGCARFRGRCHCRRRWKPRTVRAYREVLGRVKDHLAPWPLPAVRPRAVAGYVATMRGDYGPSPVRRDVAVLSSIFVTAKREELVETTPAERAERPKLPRRQWSILEPV